MTIEIPQPIATYVVDKYTDEQVTELWEACGAPTWADVEPRAHDAAGCLLQSSPQAYMLVKRHVCLTLNGHHGESHAPWRISVHEPNSVRPSAAVSITREGHVTPPGSMASTALAALVLAFARWQLNQGKAES